jgi:hypothetical protein
MRIGFAAAIVIWLMSAISPISLKAQAPTAWFGTWKLNVAKSTYNPGPAPYKRATSHIEPYEGGIKDSDDFVMWRGETVHVEWTGKFDGRDYAVEGVDYPLTNAYTQIDEDTLKRVAKVDGQITSVSRITLSTDHMTMTTVTESSDTQGQPVTTTTVYEKQ